MSLEGAEDFVDRWREGMRGSHMTGYESGEDGDGDGLRLSGPTGGDVEEVLGLLEKMGAITIKLPEAASLAAATAAARSRLSRSSGSGRPPTSPSSPSSPAAAVGLDCHTPPSRCVLVLYQPGPHRYGHVTDEYVTCV